MTNIFVKPTEETAKKGGLSFLIILLSAIGIKVAGDAAIKDPKKAPMWNGILTLLSGVGAVAVNKDPKNDWARTLLASIAAFGLVRTFKAIANDEFQAGLAGLGSKFLKLPDNVKSAINKYFPSLSGLDDNAVRVQIPTSLLGSYLPSLNRLGCPNPNQLPDNTKTQAANSFANSGVALLTKCASRNGMQGLAGSSVARMI